ncbi:MAG: leucine-rich repeat domain-containing protein [Treponema sp.]|nr:leucine-rich repeat domain-containing protein [Treponema sp.]
MKKEVFGIKDGVLIRYYENEKDDGNNDGMKKIGDLSKLLYKEGGLLVPKGVSKIGGLSNPFYNCSFLASVVIPKGVTEISGEAFKGCKNLTSVTGDRLCRTCARHSEGCADVMPASIPGSVKYVGYEAFAGCTSLKSVKLSEGTRYIGRGAFAGCTSLTDVSIPAGMTEICTDAFAGCTELKEIRYGGTRAQWAAVQRGASWCELSVESILCTDGKSEDVGSNCDKDGMYFRLGA